MSKVSAPVIVSVDLHPKSGQSPAHRPHWPGKETSWPVDALFPFRYPHGDRERPTDQPGPATATFVDLPMPIIRPYVAPYSPKFRHQTVLLTRSTSVPVTHVARELGISIDCVRDWIAQARHDARQLHEGTLSETGQAELVRLRTDKRRLLREIAILRDALSIVASEGTTNERGRR